MADGLAHCVEKVGDTQQKERLTVGILNSTPTLLPEHVVLKFLYDVKDQSRQKTQEKMTLDQSNIFYRLLAMFCIELTRNGKT